MASATCSNVSAVKPSPGAVASDDARHVAAVELLRGRADVLQRGRIVDAGLLEQVLAVDQQLAPAVRRHDRRLAVLAHEVEGLLGEGVRAELLDHRLRRLGVEHALRRVGQTLLGRDARDHVGQLAGRRRVRQQGGELVLRQGHDLRLDAGGGGEVREVVLERRDAVRLALVAPHRDGLAAEAVAAATPTASVVVVAAAARHEGGRGHEGRNHRVSKSHCRSSSLDRLGPGRERREVFAPAQADFCVAVALNCDEEAHRRRRVSFARAGAKRRASRRCSRRGPASRRSS